MKKYLVFLLFLFQITQLTAQTSRFKDGETLYVWAQSGLNMREKSDAKASKVAAIPYGAKVFVSTNIGVKIPFEVEEFKGFTVKGYWLLVKYGNTEGYVFDGFLSRLPAPKYEKGGIEDYFKAHFKKIGERYDCSTYNDNEGKGKTEKTCNDATQVYCGYSQKYESKIIYILNSCNEADARSENIDIQNITLFEGLVLVKTFYLLDDTSFKINTTKIKIDIQSTIKDGGYGCDYSIEKVANKIIIKGFCSC